MMTQTAYDYSFLTVATSYILMEASKRILGDHFVLLMQNGVINKAYVNQSQISAKAEPGYIIMMDAMLFHSAGVNTSNMIRRGINHVIGLPPFRSTDQHTRYATRQISKRRLFGKVFEISVAAQNKRKTMATQTLEGITK